MAKEALEMICETVGSDKIYEIIVDEWRDIPNLEQIFLCMGTFKDDLLVADKFLGFYETPDIKFEITVRVIKAVLIKLQILQFDFFGRTCNDANKMRRKKFMNSEVPKAIPTHC